MKVLHLSSFDMAGGAARAAYRIHQGLSKSGIHSQMLVQYKTSADQFVEALEGKVLTRARSFADAAALSPYPLREELFSTEWIPNNICKKVAQIAPDIINLNWICNGFIRVETLKKFNRPLVWTLQDMWAFTGGCHYSLGCNRYQNSCGNCPQLKSNKQYDLSGSVWNRKRKSWENIDLTIVAPSKWMAKCARSSSLFCNKRIEIIPFGLDISVFKPIDKNIARELLGLPPNKVFIIFGAIDATCDARKGFGLLQTALKDLSGLLQENNLELIIFGSSKPENPINLGFPIHYLGKLNDDLSLRVAYSAADVMIAPSIEESFGQTASESLACGTPVVVFTQTGLQDIVLHKETGYVANHCDAKDLAAGIAWVIGDPVRHEGLRQAARKRAESEYSMQHQADRYLSLFETILN